MKRASYLRSILAGPMLPVAFAATAATATAQVVILDGSTNPYILNSNPFYLEGLEEFYKTGTANSTDDAIGTFVNNGPRLLPRLGETNTVTNSGTDYWSDNQTWIYRGQFFDADGVFTFAEAIDDNTRVRIDGTLVLNNNAWNVNSRTDNGGPNNGNSYGMGANGDGWHDIEIRFFNGTGGAGTVAGTGWGGGDAATYANKGFGLNVDGTTSLDGSQYIIPTETAGGGATLFRYQLAAGGGGDIIQLKASSTVTLQGTGPSIQESTLFVQTAGVPVSLTFNNSDATQRTLAFTNTFLADGPNTDVTFAGSGNIKLGGANDNNLTGINIIKNGGTGDLIFDTQSNNLDGAAIKVLDGRVSILGNGYNPVSSLVAPIEINSPTARLRFDGVSFDTTPTTFNSSVNVNQSGTLEHGSFRTDTLTGSLTIAPSVTLNANITGGRLRVTGTTSGESINKNGNGSLQLDGFTTLTSVNVNAGRLVLNGNTTLINVPTITGGTLALRGQGTTYSFPGPLTVGTGGTLEVFPSPIGNRQTNLIGGTLVLDAPRGLTAEIWNANPSNTNNSNPDWGPSTLVQGIGNANGTNTPGSGNFTSFQNTFMNLGFPAVSVLSSSNGVETVNYPDTTGNPYGVYGANFGDNIQARFTGKFLAPVSGVYQMSTTSDDGSMIFIDGASVVDNNMFQGETNRGGSVYLTAGMHDIVMGHYEGGGGAGFTAFITMPGGTNTVMSNSLFFADLTVPTFANPINIQEDSTVNTSYFAAIASDLTVQPGKKLTTTGNLLTISSLKLGGAGTYTIDTSGAGNTVVASVLNDQGAAVTLNKNGDGLFVLDNTTSPQLTNAANAININGGLLGILLSTGGSSPTGNAALNFNGGGLALSSKGGDQTYPLPPSFGGTTPSIEARQLGSGVVGPVHIALGGNLKVITGQTLGLKTSDNYTLEVGGTADLSAGAGTVSVNGGRVNTTSNGALAGLNVGFNIAANANGTLNFRTGAPTIASLASTKNGSPIVLLGDQTNNTTLTIDQSANTTFNGAITQGGTSVGSIIKRGAGTLTLTGLGSTYSGGITIESGIVNTNGPSLGTGPVVLAGGTLQAGPSGLLGEYWGIAQGGDTGAQAAYNGDFVAFNGYYANKGAPAVSALTTTGGRTQLRFSTGTGLDGGGTDPGTIFTDQGFTDGFNHTARLSGLIYIPVAGQYTFLTRSDDGSILFIDGTKVVSNNNYQGMTNATGSITLTAGTHTISVGYYQGGGGGGLEVRFTPPGGVDQFVTNAMTGGLHALNPVVLTASSTIDPNGGTIDLGAVTIPPNLKLTTLAGDAIFASTNISGTGNHIVDKSNGSLNLGQITDGATDATFVKDGPGTAIIPVQTGTPFSNANSAIQVNNGRVFGVAGTNSPFGSATVRLNGGTLGLGTSTGNSTFNPSILILASSGITAGNPGLGSGALDTSTISLTSALNVGAGLTLSLSSTSGYSLNIDGSIGGAGNVNSTGGTVNLNVPSTLTNLTVSGPPSTLPNLTGGTFSNTQPLTATSVTVNAGGAFRSAADLTVTTATTVNANGEFQVAGGAKNTDVNLAGGIVRAVSGINDFGAKSITGTPASFTSNQLRGVLHLTTGEFTNSVLPGNTDAGVLGTQLRAPNVTAPLTGPLDIDDDAASDGKFGALFATNATGQRFTAGFLGRFNAAETGEHQFQVTNVDDNAGFWVDLNQNGIFENFGSAGSELVSQMNCCGDAPAGSVNLVAGQSYNVAMVVEDTGGNSGLTAKFKTPSGALTTVNPGDAAAAGLWSFANPASGGGIIVEAGAELRAARINQASVVALTGGGATLRLTSGSAVTDAVDALSSLMTGTVLDIGANNTLNVAHLSVAPFTTMVKSGPGTMTVANQSIGTGGLLQVDGGIVNLNGLANAFAGIDPTIVNNGGLVVNSGAIVNLAGSLNGTAAVNAGGKLRVNGNVAAIMSIGGTVEPGDGVGTLTTSSLTLDAASTVVFQLTLAGQVGGPNDLAVVNGPLTLDGTLQVLGSFPFGSGTYRLFNYSGFLTDNVLDLDPAFLALYPGSTVDVSVANQVNLVVVPEPASMSVLVAAAGLALGLRRRRRC